MTIVIGRKGRTASDSAWAPLVAGFVLYVVLFVAGFFLGAPELNNAGALGMLFVAVIGSYRRIVAFRWGAPSAWALLNIVAIVATAVVHADASRVGLALKTALGFVVFLQVYSWRLPDIQRSRWRDVLFLACCALLVASALSGHYFETADEHRLAGVFANPNNLALMGSVPLLLVRDDDSPRRQLAAHSVIVGTLVVTMTTGAILAYCVAMAFRFRRRVMRPHWALVAVLVLAGAVALDASRSSVYDRVARQFQVMHENWDSVVSARDIQYGELATEHGGASTSGLWRLTMWRRVVVTYAGGDFQSQLMGRGIGASVELFGNLPHNDYLRLLTETGALGLLAFVGFFVVLWRRARERHRPVLLFFLAYSFTENNVDNFLYLTLLMFFLGSTVASTARSRFASRAAKAPRVALLPAEAGGP